MAFKPNTKRLPDGREVIDTLTAAYMPGIKVTPNYFPELAKKYGLTRFAAKNSKGHVAYYWLLEEVEALGAKREAILPDPEDGQFIEMPYATKGD